MTDKPERTILGVITGPHGIKGEVKITSFMQNPADLPDYSPLQDKKGAREFAIETARLHKNNVLVARLKGVNTRNDAEALKRVELFVDKSRLPELEEEEFYYSDLVGLTAIDAEGDALGEVLAVQNFGAGDLLEIKLSATGKSELIPFTKDVVPVLNFEGGTVTVLLPDGLLPDESDAEARADEQRAMQKAKEEEANK